MKKIPSLFKRDFERNPKLVTREYNEDVEWVINGECVAFRKWDGCAVMIKDRELYKRFDAKNGKTPPDGFIPAQEPDTNTGHWPGWVKCNRNNKADRWLWAAYDKLAAEIECVDSNQVVDGTYEAVGPKINGNKDALVNHVLIAHTWGFPYSDVPVVYDDLAHWFLYRNIEGIVWHHKDGRMIKIKRSDFGLPWPV